MREVVCCLLIVCSISSLAQKRNGHPAPAVNQEILNKDIQRMIQNKVGRGALGFPNIDKQFTLFKKDTLNASSIPVLKYAVVRNGDGRIVLEGSITMGVIEWTADYQLTESQSLGSGQPTQNQKSRNIDVRPYRIKP